MLNSNIIPYNDLIYILIILLFVIISQFIMTVKNLAQQVLILIILKSQIFSNELF